MGGFHEAMAAIVLPIRCQRSELPDIRVPIMGNIDEATAAIVRPIRSQRRELPDIIFSRVSRARSFVSARNRSHRACNCSRATV